jgi:hypothetical protein
VEEEEEEEGGCPGVCAVRSLGPTFSALLSGNLAPVPELESRGLSCLTLETSLYQFPRPPPAENAWRKLSPSVDNLERAVGWAMGATEQV